MSELQGTNLHGANLSGKMGSLFIQMPKTDVAYRYAKGDKARTSSVAADVVCDSCTLSECAGRMEALTFILSSHFSPKKIKYFYFLKGTLYSWSVLGEMCIKYSNLVLVCIKQIVTSRLREIVPGVCDQLWGPQHKRDVDLLE